MNPKNWKSCLLATFVGGLGFFVTGCFDRDGHQEMRDELLTIDWDNDGIVDVADPVNFHDPAMFENGLGADHIEIETGHVSGNFDIDGILTVDRIEVTGDGLFGGQLNVVGDIGLGGEIVDLPEPEEPGHEVPGGELVVTIIEPTNDPLNETDAIFTLQSDGVAVAFTAEARGGTEPHFFDWRFPDGDWRMNASEHVIELFLIPGGGPVRVEVTDSSVPPRKQSATIDITIVRP